MSSVFFETELTKVQNRFNAKFGSQKICSVKLRSAVILSICSMSLLAHKSKNEKLNQDEIRKFIRTRNILNNVFKQI